MDVLPLPRSESTSSAGGDRSPSTVRCPARSLSSSAAVDRQSSLLRLDTARSLSSSATVDRQSSLLRLVTTRRAVHHQQLTNGTCTSTTPVMVPAYGVETTDEDVLRKVREVAGRGANALSVCL